MQHLTGRLLRGRISTGRYFRPVISSSFFNNLTIMISPFSSAKGGVSLPLHRCRQGEKVISMPCFSSSDNNSSISINWAPPMT